MKCILFDIDGTLLASGGAVHVASYAHAIRTIYGIEAGLYDIVPHGKLDGQIFLEILERRGIARALASQRRAELFAARYRYLLENMAGTEPESVLPGVTDLLAALQGRFILGVLTGNEERAAWHRLEQAGLRDYFSMGAFGNEAERRADLVRIALERAGAQAGRALGPREVVLVGDTPGDVECGHANAVPVIAVATGRFSAAQLRDEGAELVLHDLSERQAFERFVTGGDGG